ncbi:MAG: hypothetical protein H7255_16940 [Ramlibacter sp.]|nr:hypothetical protein [Ramlibacter sp.]
MTQDTKPMTLGEAKARHEVLIERQLEIECELAEMKRAYIVEKTENSFPARVTLEAEAARIAVEKYAVVKIMNASKNAEKAYRALLAGAILVKILNARGLGELVVEANRLAIDAGIAT